MPMGALADIQEGMRGIRRGRDIDRQYRELSHTDQTAATSRAFCPAARGFLHLATLRVATIHDPQLTSHAHPAPWIQTSAYLWPTGLESRAMS